MQQKQRTSKSPGKYFELNLKSTTPLLFPSSYVQCLTECIPYKFRNYFLDMLLLCYNTFSVSGCNLQATFGSYNEYRDQMLDIIQTYDSQDIYTKMCRSTSILEYKFISKKSTNYDVPVRHQSACLYWYVNLISRSDVRIEFYQTIRNFLECELFLNFMVIQTQ